MCNSMDRGYDNHIAELNNDGGGMQYNGTTSHRIGLDLGISYSYYINHNIKTSFSYLYKQMGYRSKIDGAYIDNWNNGMYNQQLSLDSKINLNYGGVSAGITYVTNSGFNISGGIGYLRLTGGAVKSNGFNYYPNNTNNPYAFTGDVTIDVGSMNTDSLNADQTLVSGLVLNNMSFNESSANMYTFIGVGYEWGDFNIDMTYSMMPLYAYTEEYWDWHESLNGISISVGYSKLIIKK